MIATTAPAAAITTASQNSSSSQASSSSSGGGIPIAAVAGGAAGLILILIVIVIVVRRKRGFFLQPRLRAAHPMFSHGRKDDSLRGPNGIIQEHSFNEGFRPYESATDSLTPGQYSLSPGGDDDPASRYGPLSQYARASLGNGAASTGGGKSSPGRTRSGSIALLSDYDRLGSRTAWGGTAPLRATDADLTDGFVMSTEGQFQNPLYRSSSQNPYGNIQHQPVLVSADSQASGPDSSNVPTLYAHLHRTLQSPSSQSSASTFRSANQSERDTGSPHTRGQRHGSPHDEDSFNPLYAETLDFRSQADPSHHRTAGYGHGVPMRTYEGVGRATGYGPSAPRSAYEDLEPEPDSYSHLGNTRAGTANGPIYSDATYESSDSPYGQTTTPSHYVDISAAVYDNEVPDSVPGYAQPRPYGTATAAVNPAYNVVHHNTPAFGQEEGGHDDGDTVDTGTPQHGYVNVSRVPYAAPDHGHNPAKAIYSQVNRGGGQVPAGQRSSGYSSGGYSSGETNPNPPGRGDGPVYAQPGRRPSLVIRKESGSDSTNT